MATAETRPMSAEEKKVIFASSLGTVFEWYDFYLYGSLAAIIAKQFFSGLDEGSAFIFALLAFAAGFIVRPFGAIFFGRAQALLRALVPALAGMNKVPYRTFLKWNAAGGIVFSTIVILLGYEFANQLTKLEKVLKYWAFGFLTVVIIVILVIKNKLEKRFETN